jgi:hypothetical protein
MRIFMSDEASSGAPIATTGHPADPSQADPSQDDPTVGQPDPTLLQDHDRTQIQAPEAPDPTPPDPTPPLMTIDAWLEKLRRSDRAFYNIMAMEVWSLAKSMDSLIPGFWSQFMKNRQSAMQEFVERRRQEGDQTESPAAASEDNTGHTEPQ